MIQEQDKKNMEEYVDNLQPQDFIFKEIESFLKKKEWAIQVNVNFARLISVFIAATKAQKVVEIGSLAGYSALWIARSLKGKGKVWTIERDPIRAQITREFVDKSPWGEKVISLTGKAADVLFNLKNQAPFDVLFIDADKISYPIYLDWAEENIVSGGLIMGDNTFLGGAMYGIPSRKVSSMAIASMQEFNERLANSERFTSVCLPLGDGFFAAVKK